MKNKIIVNIYVPSLDETYELCIPINETINKILELVVKLIEDYSDSEFSGEEEHLLVDPENSNPYNISDIVRDTNIKNSKLLLLV